MLGLELADSRKRGIRAPEHFGIHRRPGRRSDADRTRDRVGGRTRGRSGPDPGQPARGGPRRPDGYRPRCRRPRAARSRGACRSARRPATRVPSPGAARHGAGRNDPQTDPTRGRPSRRDLRERPRDRRPIRPHRPPLLPGRLRAGLARPAPQRLRRTLGAGPKRPAEDHGQAGAPARGRCRGPAARRAVDGLRRARPRHARSGGVGDVPEPGVRAAGIGRRGLRLPRPARLRARDRRLRHQPRRRARGVRPHRSRRPRSEGLRLVGDAHRAVRDRLCGERRLLHR